MYILIIVVLILIICIQYVLYHVKPMIKHDGQIVITTNEEGKKIFTLELDKDPEEIENLNSISFKVTGEQKSGYEAP